MYYYCYQQHETTPVTVAIDCRLHHRLVQCGAYHSAPRSFYSQGHQQCQMAAESLLHSSAEQKEALFFLNISPYVLSVTGKETHANVVATGAATGLRSVQRTFCFLFATSNGLRDERALFSKRSRVTINIFLPLLFIVRASFVSVQRIEMCTANSRSVEQTEQRSTNRSLCSLY